MAQLTPVGSKDKNESIDFQLATLKRLLEKYRSIEESKVNWKNGNLAKYCIVNDGYKLIIEVEFTRSRLFAFTDMSVAKRFMNDNKNQLYSCLSVWCGIKL